MSPVKDSAKNREGCLCEQREDHAWEKESEHRDVTGRQTENGRWLNFVALGGTDQDHKYERDAPAYNGLSYVYLGLVFEEAIRLQWEQHDVENVEYVTNVPEQKS